MIYRFFKVVRFVHTFYLFDLFFNMYFLLLSPPPPFSLYVVRRLNCFFNAYFIYMGVDITIMLMYFEFSYRSILQ